MRKRKESEPDTSWTIWLIMTSIEPERELLVYLKRERELDGAVKKIVMQQSKLDWRIYFPQRYPFVKEILNLREGDNGCVSVCVFEAGTWNAGRITDWRLPVVVEERK